jgi:tetratricopeptide (TPR) repeat protein
MENVTPFYAFRNILNDILNIVEEAQVQADGKLKLTVRPPQPEVEEEEPSQSQDEESTLTPDATLQVPQPTQTRPKSRRASFQIPSFQGLSFNSDSINRNSFYGKTNPDGTSSVPLEKIRRLSLYKDNSTNYAASNPLATVSANQLQRQISTSHQPLPVATSQLQPPAQQHAGPPQGQPFRSRAVSHYTRLVPSTGANSFELTRRKSEASSADRINSSNAADASAPATPTSTTEGLTMDAKLKRMLAKLNEPPDSIELFDVILSSEGARSDPLKPQITKLQIKEFGELLRKIIKTISSCEKLAIVIYETQWMDTYSWELLWDIVNTCPRTSVFIFARSERSYEAECSFHLRKFKRMRRTTTVKVEGLNYSETQQMMVVSWQGKPIKGISSTIVDNIFKRSNGNPLYIRSLMFALKESGQWRIDEMGVLTTISADVNLENLMLGYDLHSIIVAQFDRLDRNFQLLLKVASVLGQKFNMEDVVYFLSDMPGFTEKYGCSDKNKVASNVEEVDKFGYLERELGDIEGHSFHFKSAVVRRCISHMMVDNQRQHLHLNIARYYESKLTPSNRHRYLIPIYEHYMETDSDYQNKKLFYLEEVAHFYYQSHSNTEAIKHYRILLEFVEQLQEDMGIKLFSDIRLAQFHRELGEAYYSRGKIEEAKTHLFLSLSHLRHTVPENKIWLLLKIRHEWSCRKKFDLPGDANSTSTLPFKDTVWGELSSNLPLLDGRAKSQSGGPGEPRFVKSASSVRLARAASLRGAAFKKGMETPPKPKRRSNPLGSVDINRSMTEFSTRLSNQWEKAEKCDPDPVSVGSSHSLATSVITSSTPFSHEQFLETEVEQAMITNEPHLASAFYLKCTLITLAKAFLESDELSACEYAVLKGLNLCELFPRNSLYARFLATLGYIVWIAKGKRGLSLKYLDAADQCDSKSDLNYSAEILFHTAQTLFLMGIWEECLTRVELVLQLNYVTGDTKKRDESMKLKALIMHFMGHQSISEKAARALYSFSNHEDDIEGRFWGCCMTLANLLSTINCVEEMQDTRENLKSIWDSATKRIKTNVPAQIAYKGLLASCEYRLGIASMDACIWNDLKKMYSSSSKHHWLSAIGGFHAIMTLHSAFSSSEGLKPAHRKAAEDFLSVASSAMKKMTTCSLIQPLRSLAKGMRALLQNNPTLAVTKWKKGLEVKNTESLLFLKAALHEKISKYTENQEDARQHSLEAQRLFRKIGAQWLYEQSLKSAF